MDDYDLICIGSGPAGQRAAVQAAKLGKRVAVVEKRQVFGGVCLETGTIPSKTFRQAVLSFSAWREHGRRIGHVTVERPSMERLVERVSEVVAQEALVVRDQLARNDVELLSGRACFVGRNTVSVESPRGTRTVTARNVLIAVGTRPYLPEDLHADGETLFTSDGVVGTSRLPRTLTVVGGGVIGVEYASMFAELGVKVTIVDRRSRPLGLMDHEIVDELVHQMRRRWVTFRGNESVESIQVIEREGGGTKGAVLLASGKHLVSDAILYCAGRQAATDEIGLDAIGLETDERGRIEVDERFATSVEGVWAAGDVIGFPALAATSSEQGRLAACHMFGLEAKSIGTHFPIGIYAIPEISCVGATEEQLTESRVPYETGVARYCEIARGTMLRDDSGLFKMIFNRETRELLGVHCIGTGATELVHVGQAVLALGGGLDYFLDTVFNYPTLAECYKVAAYQAENKIRSFDALRRAA